MLRGQGKDQRVLATENLSARDLWRLLRLSEKAKRKEHGAKREANDFFSHKFSPAFFLLSARFT
jgi:hypothetical protein